MGGEPTKEQSMRAAEKALQVSREELEKRGIGWDRLAKKLGDKLDAMVTQTAKFRGHVQKRGPGRPRKNLSPVPDEVRILAEGVKLEADKDGALYDDGETVIAWNEEAHDIQIKALDMAHRLRGDFPPEERRIAGPGGGPIPISRVEVVFVSPEKK